MLDDQQAAMVERQGRTAVKYVSPIPPNEADGLLAEMYDQLNDEYLVAPPFTLHSPVPELLAGLWSIFRESLVVGQVPRVVKEAVASGVSKANRCPFCVESHTLSVHAGAGRDIAAAIERGDYEAIEASEIREVAEWAEATRAPGADILTDPPFTRDHAPEIIGTALTFHYINRMVNIFCEASPFPLPSVLDRLRGIMHRIATPMVRDVIGRSPTPGRSLAPLPEAELSKDMEWASSNGTIARAFAGFAAIADGEADERFSSDVLNVVRGQVAGWNGGDPGFGRDWIETPTADLTDSARPAARLALLAAFASYRVDDAHVARFRTQ